MDNQKDLHKGHRKRVRAEFLLGGYNENTPDHKILEHMLFYALARKDTNELAHRIVNKFGNLAGVLDADINELMKIEGVSESTAVMLKLYQNVFKVYNYQRQEHNTDFSCAEEIGDYIYSRYLGVTNERLSILGTDAKGKMLFFKFLAEGDISSVGISIKDVIKLILENNAVSIVMAHNHPGGVALPSDQDIFITRQVRSALDQIDVGLYDHIIITSEDYVSMRLSEKYRHIFE
ncbi:MAG: hypothetical protein IJZ75_07385 [Clostridia bacterium]|nr:hypothetical protein [Clostridia bacterium]